MEPTEPYLEEELDSDISSIRAEIRNLQKRRRFLSSSLLSSDYIQKRLKSTPTTASLSDNISPLVQAAGNHAESNHHRVAFSATTFPFKDPNPNSDSPNLLGVRIDVCARNGRFTNPYYVLLKRIPGDGEKRLRVHRHTIPAFISMEKLERRYLPSPPVSEDDVVEAELKPWKAKKQDLRALVRELRRELVAWHLRRGAMDLLREKLGAGRDDASDGNTSSEDQGQLPINSMGIVSLSPTTLETRYVRLEWEDGRVGRFKISSTGKVERAVVIGDQGRVKVLEDAMTGGDGKAETVLDRLIKYQNTSQTHVRS
ncbi:hypothetical protein ASPWEDRAFT_173531 [Aspergillus wentii DTO 134E9]|uniref:Cenp-O kinetochore centromere component n=1 Tax=Aspergillus wentii DTO 134E9 TaxID=1073089 RepID=A0A1L9RGP9_ASPWE|nr:uncharacterized protein ASPWEDRAFT_173531 [Aspergillus wentii DTO 134E9]KAI9927879.1 hypothetical protein MW887_002731 [Aspergillus wentii]OJJ34100.1 hypothetical protein ASPWEDRAFT_173531 [Aspergillus wentii DTO 134E9]